MDEFLPLAFYEFGYGNARASRHDFRDFLVGNAAFNNFIRLAAFVFFFFFEFFLQRRYHGIFKFRRFVKVVFALGAFHIRFGFFKAFFGFAHLNDGFFLVVEFCLHRGEFLAVFGKFGVDFFKMFFRQFIRLFLKRSTLYLQLNNLVLDFVHFLRH